jgi:amino acid transporter
MFSLGREGVIPRAFGRTVPGTGAPKNGSLAQSALGLTVIVAYAVFGWDPLVQLFFWGGSAGGLGVLFLVTLTSFAVIGYFARNPQGEDVLHRIIAPVVSSVMLLVVSYLAVDNIAGLLGVEPGSTPAVTVPLSFAVLMVAGVLWAFVLRSSRPQVYAGIGLGARATSTGGGFAAALNNMEPPR